MKKTNKSLSKGLCILLLVILLLGGAFSLVQVFQNAGDRFPPEGLQLPGSGGLPFPEDRNPGWENAPEGQPRTPIRLIWAGASAVCLLGSAACLIILFRRKTDAGKEPEFQSQEEDDVPPQRKKVPWLGILCIVIAASMILSSLPAGGEEGSSATVQETVLSGTPEAVQMQVVLTGAGTVKADAFTSVIIPQEVSVLRYHVRNGDTVHAGTPLASVDKTAAAKAMAEVHTLLLELDADLEAQRWKTEAAAITASVSGRVKHIYAQEGEKLSDVVYTHGALMLLSLDGRMKVVFESSAPLQVGEAALVTLSDGSQEQGRVESVREGIVTVTVSDEKVPYGDAVLVSDSSGASLGTGILEINSELKVIHHHGAVKKLSVEVNSRVSKGSQLMTLDDPGHTMEYQLLLSRRQELEAQMTLLAQLAAKGTVCADTDGIVSGIPEDAEIELLRADTDGYRIFFLSNTESDGSGEVPDSPPADVSPLSGIYGASLVSTGEGVLYVWHTAEPTDENADLGTLENRMNQFSALPYSGSGEIVLLEKDETKTVDLADLKTDDLLLLRIEDSEVTEILRAQRGSSQAAGGQFPGGSIGGFGGFGGFGAVQETVPGYEEYVISEQTILQLNHIQEVQIGFPVDELDILTLRTGLSARVTLDAIPGQSFTGTITRIDKAGVNEGGNTKFTVTVTLPRDGNMLDGMNAAVEIVTDTIAAKIAVPAAALLEEDGRTYLYTSYDEKTDTLGGRTEVHTGFSDGEWVEITAGLTEGDSYFYRYAGTVTYQFLST